MRLSRIASSSPSRLLFLETNASLTVCLPNRGMPPHLCSAVTRVADSHTPNFAALLIALNYGARPLLV